MRENQTGTDNEKALFANLVMMLSSSVMQQLGKIVNPLTGKAEMNLEVAQVTIDMLSMLQTKTCGNLDVEEKRMLDDIVASLQMNYVASSPQAGVPAAAAADEKAGGPEAAEDEMGDEDSSEGTPGAEAEPRKDARDPKFHKSYG